MLKRKLRAAKRLKQIKEERRRRRRAFVRRQAMEQLMFIVLMSCSDLLQSIARKDALDEREK